MGAFAIASAHQVVIKRALAESLSPAGRRDLALKTSCAERADLTGAPFETLAPLRLPKRSTNSIRIFARAIGSNPDRAVSLSAAKAFRLETFHLGFLYRRAITVNLIRDGIASPLPYSPNLFDFGSVKIDKPLPIDTGFGGFRLHYPLNDPHVYDEVISFSEPAISAFSDAISNMGFRRAAYALRPARKRKASFLS